MTTAKRLALLLALPIVVLLALSGFFVYELVGIQKKSRFVSELQIESLGALGNISSQLGNARVELRNSLLAEDPATTAEKATAFEKHVAEIANLLARYGDNLISDERDRREYSEFRELYHDWTAEARNLISLSSSGHRAEARAALFSGDMPNLGRDLYASAFRQCGGSLR